MQVKKLEEIVGRPVFHRDSRSVELTADGAFLLAHARRMLALNREALARFVQPDLSGVVRLGATNDITERFLPGMLRRLAETHPGLTVDVAIDGSDAMRAAVRSGTLDLALITCGIEAEGAEVLYRERLVWAACSGGVAAERTPLPVSVWDETCVWRTFGLDALDAAGRPWRIAFQSAHLTGQRAAIMADLAVAPIPASALGGEIVEAGPEHGLPALPDYGVALVTRASPEPAASAAADHLRASFAACC
jgi:DNA-binding transcriptional LysR family regulator